ncbi:anti-repressor protein [Candidatus Magnetoovum chiemensis]|nr:anti-repressor protein [Candidatus Magnetoovum chiemensis]
MNTQAANLIPIQSFNATLKETVNARELWSFLESKQQFGNWIQNRIEEYGFSEGEDFQIILSKTATGGRPAENYHITLNMAKELAMVERNEKGRQARQYFIECEEKLRNNALAIPSAEVIRIRRESTLAVLDIQRKLSRSGRDLTFVKRLIRYRKAGLLNTEAGKLLDVSRDTVRRYESLLKQSGIWEAI